MNLAQLKQLKQSGEKIACLTAYDANMAHWVEAAGCEVILVGDSLGMVVQGHATTLPVTLEQMVYHTEMVARGAPQAWIVADLPFMSDATLTKGLEAAQALIQAGANMVKVEGGLPVVPLVHRLAELGVPVCGHLGLLPQSVLRHGYRNVEAEEALLASADALVQAGVEMIVLECVRAETAEAISRAHAVPVIGIGSGPDTDGQVLVLHDVLGLTIGRIPSFARNFMAQADSIQGALRAYVQAVKSGYFPEV